MNALCRIAAALALAALAGCATPVVQATRPVPVQPSTPLPPVPCVAGETARC